MYKAPTITSLLANMKAELNKMNQEMKVLGWKYQSCLKQTFTQEVLSGEQIKTLATYDELVYEMMILEGTIELIETHIEKGEELSKLKDYFTALQQQLVDLEYFTAALHFKKWASELMSCSI